MMIGTTMTVADEQETQMDLMAQNTIKDIQESIDRIIFERIMLARDNRAKWNQTFGSYLEDYGIAEALRQWPNLLEQELVDTTNDLS